MIHDGIRLSTPTLASAWVLSTSFTILSSVSILSLALILSSVSILAAEGPGTGPRVRAEKPRGVFSSGETPSFIIEGVSDIPKLRVLAADGSEAAAPSAEAVAGGFRVAMPGLEPGPYRLSVQGSDAIERRTSFAVLPPMADGLVTRESAVASDGALSWLVHDRGPNALRSIRDSLRLARLAGLRYLRDRIAWGEVEPREGEFRWGRYEETAAASKEEGIGVYQILHATPHWGRADHEAKRMPDDLRTAWRFFKAAQERLGDRVDAWETWNEPDIQVFSDDPADQLAAFQKAAYLGLKAADPSCLVLMVSLAAMPGSFIESFLENETAPYFEVYNYHSYDSLENYPKKIRAHDSVLERFGLAGMPIWLTEAGIGLRTEDGNLSWEQAIEQAEFLPRAYAISLGMGTARHFFFVFPHYIENGVQFGLLERDLAPGPGYSALAALSAAVGNARDPRELTGLPEGISGWLFARGDGRDAAIVWSASETSISVPPDLEAMGIWGGKAAVDPARGVAISKRASYFVGRPDCFAPWKPVAKPTRSPPVTRFEGLASGLVLRFIFSRESTRKDKEAWCTDAEGRLSGKLQIYNFGTAAFEGSLKLSGADIEATLSRKELKVDPMGLETVEVSLRWREAAAGSPEGSESPGNSGSPNFRKVEATMCATPQARDPGSKDSKVSYRSSKAVIRITR